MASVSVRCADSDSSSHTSKFKARDLLALASSQRSYLSPLAVVAHIDVNAFFAQVEQIRMGLSKEDAVVCVQWSSIIAVSYAAREYGISRMDTIQSAKLKCDKLIPAHTAVFKKGQNFWRYHDEEKELPSPINHKVSLDPYRRESRKIMRVFNEMCDLVEKASVDECFMDLGRNVLNRLEELVPGFIKEVESMEKQDFLPPVPKDLAFDAYGVVVESSEDPLENNQPSPHIKDWDDVLILLGSVVMNEIRQKIEKELGYTTSCGVARVKTVAKLASGFKKPDNQTIVRNSSINNFLTNFDFTDFWSMGGKTGEYIKAKLYPPSSDSMSFIREKYELHELEDYLEDKQLAEKLYLMVRGAYAAPISAKLLLKSMNSNKNIRGNSGASLKDASEWIRVFAADLVQRLVETDDENGNRTRAKTISIHFKCGKDPGNTSHSKQSSLPIVPLEELEDTFYKYGVNLLKQSESQFPQVYPLINLSMTISNFEQSDGLSTSIMGFVKKGDASSAFRSLEKSSPNTGLVHSKSKSPNIIGKQEVHQQSSKDSQYTDLPNGKFKCNRCEEEVDNETEHDDFHYAIEITEQLNGSASLSLELKKFSSQRLSYAETKLKARSSSPTIMTQGGKKRVSSTNTGKGPSRDKKMKTEKGQSRLPF